MSGSGLNLHRIRLQASRQHLVLFPKLQGESNYKKKKKKRVGVRDKRWTKTNKKRAKFKTSKHFYHKTKQIHPYGNILFINFFT